MRSVNEAQGNAVKAAIVGHYVGKFESRDRRCWDSVFLFECAGASGDRRCAAGSTRNTQDRGLAVFLDLCPEVPCVITEDVTRLASPHSLDRGHVLGKPGLHLIQKFAASPEAGIDEVDSLAIEAVQAWSERRE